MSHHEISHQYPTTVSTSNANNSWCSYSRLTMPDDLITVYSTRRSGYYWPELIAVVASSSRGRPVQKGGFFHHPPEWKTAQAWAIRKSMPSWGRSCWVSHSSILQPTVRRGWIRSAVCRGRPEGTFVHGVISRATCHGTQRLLVGASSPVTPY